MAKSTAKLDEAPPFYGFVHDLATRLVGAQGSQIDEVIDDCLARIGKYFAVNQVGLGQITKSGELMPALRAWGDRPSRTFLKVDPPGAEMVAHFCREGSLVWNRLADLDELPQFREHVRQVGALSGAFWLHNDLGSHVEGLALSRRNPEVWPEDTAERLGLVGNVLFNALYRRRAEVESERLRQFEQVVSDIASKFVHMRAERLDEEIQGALGQVSVCVDADLCTLVQWSDSGKSTLVVSHEWDAESVGGPHFRGADVSDAYPWAAARMRQARPLFISKLDDFPPEATAERAICEQIGIQSVVWAPFAAAHGLQGYIVVSTVNRPGPWLAGVMSRLGLVGNVLASAIERRDADLNLQQAYDQIRTLKDHLEAENVTLREEITSSFTDDDLIGRSHAFRSVLHQVEQVANTDSTVLLLGETGTGKGNIARRIHQRSGRKDHPMVTVNCAALPAALIESELFGHEKGAFTGAVDRKIGRFELADGATIFLDEIGDLPLELQSKLLRVLQDHEFERLGSSQTKTVDTRVIAATNRDLDTLIAKDAFRRDLYYRLGVFPIRIPPLHERSDDIPLLVWYFITNLQTRLGKTFDSVPTRVMNALISHDWPGNVRELQNIVERAMILSEGPRLELESVLPAGRTGRTSPAQTPDAPAVGLEEVERAHIVSVLEKCAWRVRGKDGAAERLRLNRSTLQSRMKKLGIRRPTPRGAAGTVNPSH